MISLEYSRNLGLTWHLIRYYNLNPNDEYLIHEDLIDEMKYEFILIRLVFLSNSSKCITLEQVSNILRNIEERFFFRLDNCRWKQYRWRSDLREVQSI